MKIYLNTHNINHIINLNDIGIIDGITTNNKLINKEKSINNKKDLLFFYKNISSIITGDLIIDLMSYNFDYDNIIKESISLSKISSNIVITIPITVDGFKAIYYLNSKKIKTNCTFISTINQALLAAKAGSTYINI